MAESSSDSDNFLHGRVGTRGPLRATHSRARNHGAGDVTEKIHTLASTLQDTNRNLRHVDQMLGQYREYNNEQTEAIATLKETLEQSIGQLRSQRLSRNSGMRSASLSSLYTSDLDDEAATGSHHFQPTSPLRVYGDSQSARRRRSRSANVRFVDEANNLDQLHSLHHSLRDLSSEQVRLGDDISRELSRRYRTDAETKKILTDLSEKLTESQRQETVSERVERRLQEIEQEMRTERQVVERHQDQLGHMSMQLQEVCKIVQLSSCCTCEPGSDKEARGQIEDLHSQLLRAEADRVDLQHQVSQVAVHRQSCHDEQEDDRRIRSGTREKQELEKQILELRAKLNHSAVMSEVEELKRCIEHKDKEKAQLAMHIQVLTSDLENREKQQQRMLDQLKEIQSCYKACESERRQTELQTAELAQQLEESTKEADRYLAEFRQSETLRLETEKKKEELKVKAQESIRHWKLKYKKLERDMVKQNETINQLVDKSNQVLKEKDDLKAQLLSAIHQIENLRKELSDVLIKRAQQEEELHCKEVKLSETKSQQIVLEQEIKEVHDKANTLESELQKQILVQNQMRNEKERLEEELETANMINEKDQERFLEMQEDIKNLSAIRAELTNRIAEEEKVKKEILKNFSDLQKHQESKQEEMTTTSWQLKMERDIHQQELADLRSELKNVKTKHERNVQELMKLFRQEKDETENHIRRLKTELLDEKNVVKAQRRQVEKMKTECDKMTEELTQSEQENTKLRRKYELVKQELEEKDKQISSEDDHLRRMEEARLQLRDQLRCLETEQESILTMIGSEIDAACEILSRDSVEKFKVIISFQSNDPHRWLAETKTKLQWMCEEVKERERKEWKLRRHLSQSQEQLKHLTLSKECERQSLFEQIKKQEHVLEEVNREKRGELSSSFLLMKEEKEGRNTDLENYQSTSKSALSGNIMVWMWQPDLRFNLAEQHFSRCLFRILLPPPGSWYCLPNYPKSGNMQRSLKEDKKVAYL
uniref:Centrosomal protein 128 n=1 Tax=Chelonoidis abingdonii TaxID=106734 RepID=A0A8C0JEA7_CHEAB